MNTHKDKGVKKIKCPSCGVEWTGKKGEKFVACSICGACTHPKFVWGECIICKAPITDFYLGIEDEDGNDI